jgi:fructosamine-3-kinase
MCYGHPATEFGMHVMMLHATQAALQDEPLHAGPASPGPPSCVLLYASTTGFSGDFWRAYHELIPKAPLFDKRQELYLLYHYLNHTNLFGGEQPMCIAHVTNSHYRLAPQRDSVVDVGAEACNLR